MTYSVIEQLQQLGFGQYEAQAYITLLQRSPLNGYELAKESGIPRPNIYAVLQKLEERGAVVRQEASGGTSFAPVASAELIRRLRSQFQSTLEAARCALDDIGSRSDSEGVWNAHGYPALLEHARAFVEASEKQLLLAVWPQEAALLADSLQEAERRGVEISTLCLAGCAQECGACRGQVHRYTVAPHSGERWLVIIPDHQEVLAGEIKTSQATGDDAQAVRTRQKMLIDLSAWYIRHSIALAALLEDLGDQLEPMLSPRTRRILASAGPGGESGGWLEHMRNLLDKRTSQ